MDSLDSGESGMCTAIWSTRGWWQKAILARAGKHHSLIRKLKAFWKFLTRLVRVCFNILNTKPGASIPPNPARRREIGDAVIIL